MKLLNTTAAAILGVAAALSAGVLTRAAPAEALPPGTYFCHTHLVPVQQQCPAAPPAPDRWVACPSETLYFVLDDPGKCRGNLPRNRFPDEAYTMNCWGRNIYLGKICPQYQPQTYEWQKCWNAPGDIWTLDGDCNRPS